MNKHQKNYIKNLYQKSFIKKTNVLQEQKILFMYKIKIKKLKKNRRVIPSKKKLFKI